ncbi:hypothetical protein F511_30190 [Dorcoceras hygrometricum]|uniref:Uncharacterized protein n=1 Tax=Dorcoceras hygrometricum TaxID=472368 RepID=A0A2Z7CI66_9LAMI|nr:hypothetical protein F511_30190 [Dorcoceras hygrometricum]
MGSNPNTESNYKTAVKGKNKMQMLCMRPGTTAEGYNQGRELKNSMHSSTESAIDMCGHAGLNPRPAVKPGFPRKNTDNKTTKPQRDMGSNPNTESNYKTAVKGKNKMQMLCMRPGTTAEGYNQGRELKNSMHSSTESAIDMCGHGECRTCGSYPLKPTLPPISDASTSQPAVAQPMNCGS